MKSQQLRASFVRQYWMVFAGTGLAMVVVTAGVAAAIRAFKAETTAIRRDSPPTAVEATSKTTDSASGPVNRPAIAPGAPCRVAEITFLAAASQPTVTDSDVSARPMLIAKQEPADKAQVLENTCGTKVCFQSSPAAACKKAEAESKLVFILHVSGNFEDPQFT
jgi:hypothetical protein